MTKALPAEFKEFERWTFWALATERERYDQRARSSIEELRAFCGALGPRMEELIQYLSKFKWGQELSEEDRNLFHLGLGYMEAVIPIDLGWKRPLAEDSYPVSRLALADR